MEAVGCGAAALSLGQVCLTTVHRLQTLLEKYRNAPQAIAALHIEIVAIGASMWYIKMILDKSPELEASRFCGDPDLAQILFHALSGCRVVLVSLQHQVSSFIDGLDQKGSMARRAKRKYLWKESAIKELLHTVRGQHAAISSIIQCLQLENATDLATRVDKIRVALSETQLGVSRKTDESSLSIPPSREGTALERSGSHNLPGNWFEDNDAASPRHQVHMSPIGQESYCAIQHESPATRQNDMRTSGSDASVVGLAPSTVVGGEHEDLEVSSLDEIVERRSAISGISGISVSSLTRRWLESQLGPEEASKTFSRVKDVADSVADDDQGDSFSLRAPDTETFLENIRYFMPSVADFAHCQDASKQGAERMETVISTDTTTETRSIEKHSSWSMCEDSDSLLTVSDPDAMPDQESTALGSITKAEVAAEEAVQTQNKAGEAVVCLSYRVESLVLHTPAEQLDSLDLGPTASNIHHNPPALPTTAQNPEERTPEECGKSSPSKGLPAIPPMYAKRHSWEHDKDAASPYFDHQLILRGNYRFSQALIIAAPDTSDDEAPSSEEVPESKEKRYQLPPIMSHTMYGYGNMFLN